MEKINFSALLREGLNQINKSENEVTVLNEKIISSPDALEVHDVNTVMENARSSLDLAQFIIDRLVNRKNEIYAIRNSNFIKEKLIKG